MFHRIYSFFALALILTLLVPAAARANSVTFSGKIVWMLPTGFSLNSGRSCGYLPILIGPSTQIIRNGMQLAPGTTAQVTGSGNCRGINAAQVVLSGSTGSVPKHVLTADYLGAPYGSTQYPLSTYARYLSWAEADTTNASAFSSAGIKTMYYTNPNRQQPGDNMYTTVESTFAHDCSGVRISNTWNPNMDLMDVHSSVLRNLWRSVAQSAQSRAHFDAIFEDNANDMYGTTNYPCRYLPADWLATTNAMNASLGAPIIYNALGILSAGYGVSDSIGLNSTSLGGMMEGCYAQPGSRPKAGGAVWRTIENTELIMAKQGKLFVCYGNDTGPAIAAADVRLFTYASFLLTYDINTSVLWEYFSGPSRFHVQPESALVAMAPLAPTPAAVAALEVTQNVFAREYNACYVAGVAVGPCAAVVNTDYYFSRPFPYTKYHHTLVITGGGALDGGSVFVNGGAPRASLAPSTGVIAFQ